MPGLWVSIAACGTGSTLSYQLTVIFQNTFRFLVKVLLPCQDPELWQIAEARTKGLPRLRWEWKKGEPDPGAGKSCECLETSS